MTARIWSSRRVAAEKTSLALAPGKVLGGKYVLDQPAGVGGMAELWVATNRTTGGQVCIKVFVPRAALLSTEHTAPSAPA